MKTPRVRSAGARQLRLVVGIACAVALLATASCGSESTGVSASDPASDPTSGAAAETPSDSASSKVGADSSADGGTLTVGEVVEPGQAQVVSVSDVDVETPKLASALPTDEAVDSYLAGLDPRLADAVRPMIDRVELPSDHVLFASVVSVGCDEPTRISWTKTFDGIETTADLPKPGVQCLVPMTSVALFLVPN